jgi:hypothetical protein
MKFLLAKSDLVAKVDSSAPRIEVAEMDGMA